MPSDRRRTVPTGTSWAYEIKNHGLLVRLLPRRRPGAADQGWGKILKIYKVKLTKAKLEAMSADERSLLLQLGHASNEINVFSKLILMMRKFEAPNQIVDHVEAGQTFIFMRVLIGKLHEAWRLFQNRFQAHPAIRTKYTPKLTPEAATALNELNKHFGAGSSLPGIRNKISFHYSDEDNLIEENFQRLSGAETWEFYLAPTPGNTFFFASELVSQATVLGLVKSNKDAGTEAFSAQRFEELCDTIIVVSRHITELFGMLIGELAYSMGAELEEIEIPTGPKMSAFVLPFFFDENDSFPTQQGASNHPARE